MVFRRARSAFWATSAQLAAWALQLFGAFALLLALASRARRARAAAAAVLFAVNVTAVLPATPSNVGVFQLAVLTVLAGGYGVPAAAALGYGIILQAVEVVTAVGSASGADPRGCLVARRPHARAGRHAGRAVSRAAPLPEPQASRAPAYRRRSHLAAEPRATPACGCWCSEHPAVSRVPRRPRRSCPMHAASSVRSAGTMLSVSSIGPKGLDVRLRSNGRNAQRPRRP